MNTVQKRLGFTKGSDRYDIRYDNVRDLIHTLVDYADDGRFNLNLMDVFVLVHRLAYLHTSAERQKR